MTETYRLKFKSAGFEVEIEGPDQEIINQRLDQLIALSQQAEVSSAAATDYSIQQVPNAEILENIENIEEEAPIVTSDGRVEPERIAEIIRASKRYKAIENKILKKSNQLYRILLCLHYARAVYGDRGFSTGIIEEVTAALGKRLRKSNIAAQIKLNPDLFESDREPGKGITAHYLLTDAGVEKLEDKLNS